MQLLVATLTPFDARGRVDLGRLRAHVLWLRLQGVDGFVPTGTAGEFPYLGDREKEAVHRTVIDAAGGAPVYPCPWDASVSTTQFLAETARDAGAKGILLPPPLYYGVEERVLREWYANFARLGVPVLAHHSPTRFPTSISAELYEALRRDGTLAGMKDSSADLFRLKRLGAADPGRVWAGGDRLMSASAGITGLAGFVSGLANVWPQLCVRLFKNGERQLEDALIDRSNRIRRAGGLRAMKALLKMGCRLPLPEPEAELLEGLPPAESL